MLNPVTSKKKAKTGSDAVAATIAKVTGKVVPYKRLAITELEPNDWNPNKLDDESRVKLTRGMKHLLDTVGVLPPVVVRPHPSKKGMYQIIDGFHRWDILRAEGYEEVDAYVIDVDTKTAMLLTDTLNYLRGQPDAELHAQYLHRLLQDHHMPAPEAAEYLPMTASEIEEQLDAYDLELVEVTPPKEEAPPDDTMEGNDQFLVLKFAVAREQAEIIEREIARISGLLKGKNTRGRALEFMAVNSSQTELDNLTGESQPKKGVTFAPTASKVKKKLKEAARG